MEIGIKDIYVIWFMSLFVELFTYIRQKLSGHKMLKRAYLFERFLSSLNIEV